MALITTLIPAYKPEFLGELLLGLLHQSCRDFKVILSDDSPGEHITGLLRRGYYGSAVAALDIECVPGPKHPRLNQRALIERWNGRSPFVHMHLDDDVIYPDFYRTHLAAHAAGPFSASVSRRWTSHVDARPVHGFEWPDFVASSPLRQVPVDAQTLFQSMLPGCANWMGEFSNMLISATGAAAWPWPRSGEDNYFGWPDVGFLLEAVQRAPIAVVNEHLSVFRQHSEQTTRKMHNHGGRVSSLAWATYALLGWRQGRISARQAVQAISINVRQCLQRYGEDDAVINRFLAIVQHEGTSLEALYRSYMPFWHGLLASDRATAPRPQLPASSVDAAAAAIA